MKRLSARPEDCSGCRICELACSMVHHGAFNPRKGLIRIEIDRTPGPDTPISEIDVPHVCLQCTPAPCAEACPTDAFRTDQISGVWTIDELLCTACGACAESCPHGMVRLGEGSASKCDLCGGDPLCARLCPTGALRFE